jgi:hypothetical protein
VKTYCPRRSKRKGEIIINAKKTSAAARFRIFSFILARLLVLANTLRVAGPRSAPA